MRYLFEGYTFDIDRRELRRGADVVPVAPQVFDLLNYLISNRERVVTKDDLIRAVWKSRIITDAALTTRLNAVRSAIGDTGEKQHLIKTLPRRGFRFVATVQEDPSGVVEPVGAAAHNADTMPTQASAPSLSIVVLPFANLSDDLGQDYFVDGITESLTTDLSRISGSFVIGRHTAFTYKDKAVDLKQVGRELNVRYVLEGSVQRCSDRLRVSVQLADARTSAHLWADRFDKPVADLFDMQDEIVSRLANALDAELIAAEARRAEHSVHPDAMDLVFQGRSCFNGGLIPDYMTQARRFFEQALALDPENIEAMVGLARVDQNLGASLMTDDRSARLAAAETIIAKVLTLAPKHASAHAVLGAVQIFTKRAAQSIAEFEQALALDRNLARAHALIGLAKLFLGRGQETEAHVNEAFRLSPRDTFASEWMIYVGIAKAQLGADAEAVSWMRRGLDANRNYSIAHFHLGAALARLGELEQARTAVQAGLALDPNFSIHRFRSHAPTTTRERIIEGMRLAGVPEG